MLCRERRQAVMMCSLFLCDGVRRPHISNSLHIFFFPKRGNLKNLKNLKILTIYEMKPFKKLFRSVLASSLHALHL
ncbi:hypothetical protein EUGRSUZ_J01126 [Eucalyptus grandis]|uniref:Uncharacterized protein n=2 Tax=Eucalyptus grandis TaxID=71139 RepID=A0ACC3J457_EUCGR|nr:hypothetical protein EUGRSUZ_J01126 [Eucalyptus grandis]